MEEEQSPMEKVSSLIDISLVYIADAAFVTAADRLRNAADILDAYAADRNKEIGG